MNLPHSSESTQQSVTIHVLGRAVQVPHGLTIMKAMEYAGFRLVHGVGCRGGFCGSCGLLYRLADDYKLRPALACQTTVEDGMQLAAIPFVPANRARHDVAGIDPTGTMTLLAARYPELGRCVACNSCTKACPQELQVMDYVQLALRDDWEGVARESFDCIQCGLCAIRCPADIAQHHVAQLARRAYGLHGVDPSPQLGERVAAIEAGHHRRDLERLLAMKTDDLRALYQAREIEKAT
jgi:succinate dehydrogenase/fumarate reductase-like Fe-S protein